MEKSTVAEASAVSFRKVDEASAGQRVDNFLLKLLKGVPKSKIYRIIRKGEVRVNKGRCKPETRLRLGDSVRIPPISRPTESAGTARPKVPDRLIKLLEAAVIYEDAELLVVNKPAGLAVHGGSGLSFGVIEILRAARSRQKYLELVHRLDRDTSGVLMLAKKRRCLLELHRMLQENRVEKIYHAWVDGVWPLVKSEVTAPIRKNTLKSGERIVVVAGDGKPSETRYRLLKSNAEFSLIEAKPVTGRTHQIRVHCQFAGHPILGDEKYGAAETNQAVRNRGINRMCLHAFQLRLHWPGRPAQEFMAPWELEDAVQFCQ